MHKIWTQPQVMYMLEWLSMIEQFNEISRRQKSTPHTIFYQNKNIYFDKYDIKSYHMIKMTSISVLVIMFYEVYTIDVFFLNSATFYFWIVQY